VPGNHGIRFDDDQSGSPLVPHGAQPFPEDSIGRRQFWPLDGSMENAKLVPQREVLQMERGPRLKVADAARANTCSVLSATRKN
jgi:hypothetical protein